jgi:hypothetical protein
MKAGSCTGAGGNPEMGLTLLRFMRAAQAGLIIFFGALLASLPLAAATIPVTFPEGSIHGFLVLRTPEGNSLASGDLLEIARGAEIQRTTVFRFKDGSLFEETAVFSQQGVYTLLTYRLEQSGPAFAEDTKVSLERATGKYRVETKVRKDGSIKVIEGSLALPPDVYNGMIPTVVKDLHKGAAETVHFVAFTPEPRMIQLEIAPAGGQVFMIGEVAMTAVHYVLKPRLGPWQKIFATLLGRMPKDAHAWILDADVPAFVGFEGQLYPSDPVWRIDLVSPTRP